MGWRYRKSISIIPGVRVNFGLHSSSISFGGKGFRTTYSSTGRVTRSVGIPGTGLSYVSTSNPGRQSNQQRTSGSSRHTRPGRPYIPRDSTQSQAAAPAVDTTQLNEDIRNIYRTADVKVDWKQILLNDSCDNPSEEWDYYKARVDRVLDGDIDTYFELIRDLNPLDDLLRYGSEFECGTDDPRMMSVHFKVNSGSVLSGARALPREQYNLLLQDYVCGCAIRIARDMFALLPLRHIIVDAENNRQDILSVDFTEKAFMQLDFETVDASDTVEQFQHEMDFDIHTGFAPIVTLDNR